MRSSDQHEKPSLRKNSIDTSDLLIDALPLTEPTDCALALAIHVQKIALTDCLKLGLGDL
jgi:hypothetical protein